MASREQRSALDRLAELRTAITAAQERVSACEQQANRSRRQIDAASAALRSYYASIEDGDEPDGELERRLRDDLAAVQARMAPRLVTERGHTRMEYVDLEAEGRLAAVRGAVDDAESAFVAFIRDERDALQAEMSERACEARDELVETFAALDRALGGWRRIANVWRDELLPHWGDISPAELPNLAQIAGPLGDASLKVQQALGGAIDARGLYPMPASLAPGAEDGERHMAPLPGWEHVPRVVSSHGGVAGF